MADTTTIITGNLTDNPELRFAQGGAAVANFRVAVTPACGRATPGVTATPRSSASTPGASSPRTPPTP